MTIPFKFYQVNSIFNARLVGGTMGRYPAINHVCAKTKKDAIKICKENRGKSELSNPRDHYYTGFNAEEISFDKFMLVSRAYHTLYQFEDDKNKLTEILYNNLIYPYDYCECYQGYFIREEGKAKLGLGNKKNEI